VRFRRAPKTIALALVACVVLALATISGAQAQGDAALIMRKVDAKDPANVKVDFVWTGPQGDLAGASLSQNDETKELLGAPAPIAGPRAIVFVIDTSKAMDDDGALISAREGASQVVDASPDGTQFGVVQAGQEADLKLELTKDKTVTKNAIEGLAPTDGAKVWGALRIAGEMLKASPEVQPNIVLAVASNSLESSEEPVGRTAVLSSGATMWTIEKMGAMRAGPYDSLTSKAGGQVFTTDDANAVGGLITTSGTQINTQQFQVAYNSGLSDQQVADLTLTVGGESDNASFLPGSVYLGEALHPEVGSTSSLGLPMLDNKAVLGVALILVLIAAAAAAYAVTSLFVRDDLSNALQPYADPYGGALDDDDDQNALQKSAIVKRAVELTEQVADNQGFLTRAEGALERANLPLRAGEAMTFYVVIVIVVTLLGLFFTRNLLGGIVVGVLAALIPVAVVNYMGKRRRKTFMGQLPDTLQLLAGTLRAGYSLMQGVEAVSQEVTDPMGLELRRVVTEARLGRPLEESLEASADRMDSPDFAWAVMAIRIQREVGGNLSELLMTVADTMVQRERLRRDVASLTAEGRMSALVLGCLPAGLGIIMYILNPKYVGVLFTDPLGIGLLIAAVVSMIIGFLWMRKIINIEI
jgi:tight adherence protein B